MKPSINILTINFDSNLKNEIQSLPPKWTINFFSDSPNSYNDVNVLLFHLTSNTDLQLFSNLKNTYPSARTLLLSTENLWKEAHSLIQQGVDDYLFLPTDVEKIEQAIARSLALQEKDLSCPFWELVGKSDPVLRIFETVKKVAPTESTVLIQGESGTGKELIARAIHNNSLRFSQPFVSVNCGAFTPTLLESELFGHLKGSFTGADRNKKGLVEAAEGGTFFLDEISEMPIDLQVKLLRLLEAREFLPVGANRAVKTNVRFVCATNRHLKEEVKTGSFREDLFYRLNVIPLVLPPLREREEDLILLVHHFINKYAPKMNSSICSCSAEALAVLKNHSWPGNVRELENTIQRTLALAPQNQTEIQLNDLDPRLVKGVSPESTTPSFETKSMTSFEIPDENFNLDKHLENIERQLIIEALRKTEGSKTEAAKLLGIKFRSLCYKIDKYEIS